MTASVPAGRTFEPILAVAVSTDTDPEMGFDMVLLNPDGTAAEWIPLQADRPDELDAIMSALRVFMQEWIDWRGADAGAELRAAALNMGRP